MENLTSSGIITLTTDFGLDDAYVGIVKAVILGIFPKARIVDLTHNLKPQAIEEAAFVLLTSVKYFPQGTVHMAVVDPGVGTSRRPILAVSRGQILVGPDNGIFTDFLDDSARVYHLNRPNFFMKTVSHTFHARDIFAPVSAHVAKGVRPDQAGEITTDPVKLARPQPMVNGEKIVGMVIHVDRFGNLITNIKAELVPDDSIIRIAGKEIPGISQSYSGNPRGTLLALAGSSGFMEIALASDNAAARLKVSSGQTVEVRKS